MRHQRQRATIRAAQYARAGVVLLYHMVAQVPVDPWGMAVSPARFEQQMEVIASAFRPLTLTELADGVRTGRCPPRAVAVTFDDGYANNLSRGLPVLERHGIPTTIFVTTDYTSHGREFWWDELARLILGTPAPPDRPPLRVRAGGQVLTCPRGPAHQVLAAARDWLYRRDPQELSSALDQIRTWADEPGGTAPRPDYRPMTGDELAAIDRSELISLGAHTRTHPLLGALDPRRQADEINGSILDLRERTGAAPTAFAYPFGAPRRDYTRETVRLVRASGVRMAVSTRGTRLTGSSSSYELPRFFTGNLPIETFERWLTNCFAIRRGARAREVARQLYGPAHSWRHARRSGGESPDAAPDG